MTVPIDAERMAYELAVRNWTGRTLARVARIAYPTVSHARNGRNVKRATLEAIAAAFAAHPPNVGAVRLAKSPQTKAAVPGTRSGTTAHVEGGVSAPVLQEASRAITTQLPAEA